MSAIVKRVLDVFLASVGLVLAAPLMLLIALAVRLEGPGRIIFTQRRLGQGGTPFTLYKFRKFQDASGETGPGVTMVKDARMTRLGEILERTKLDELPQLWNILRGDMSFVGPRPESLRYQDLFVGEYRRILDYRPGIFGPNQIAFRNESELYPHDRDPEEYYRSVLFPKKAQADLKYFTNRSMVYDIVWILKGLWVSVLGAVSWRRMMGMHGGILTVDLVAVLAAWVGANAIRFSGIPDDRNQDVFMVGLWLMPAVVLPVLMLGGCYRHPVRMFALVDAVRLTYVSCIGWILAYLILIAFFYRHGSVMLVPLGLLLLLPLMVVPRLWRRERWRRQVPEEEKRAQHRVVIYGAGKRGSALLSLLQQGFPNAQIIGFLDDNDAAMRGRMVLGYKVLGSERDLNTIHGVYKVEGIWMTFIPDEHKYRRLVKWCTENGVKLVVLPTTPPFASLVFGEHEPGMAGSESGTLGPRIQSEPEPEVHKDLSYRPWSSN